MTQMHTVGLVRFSVLTTDYYTDSFDTPEAMEAHVFSPERMELRFRLFEKLCLQSLARQTDPDFVLIVLTSARLPEPYRERLEALLAPLPNVVLRTAKVGPHYRLVNGAYNAVPSGDATHRLAFRLDDDDAVPLDYVARIKRIAESLVSLHGGTRPTIIALNRGYYVKKGEKGNQVYDAIERMPLSVGTAMLHPVDFRENPYRFNHRNFAQHYNTYSDITEPGFLRAIHGDNMSVPTSIGVARRQSQAEVEAGIARWFGLDRAAIDAL